jgi:hypothetical protein
VWHEFGAHEKILHGYMEETSHAQFRWQCANEIKYASGVLLEKENLPRNIARKTSCIWQIRLTRDNAKKKRARTVEDDADAVAGSERRANG